MRIYARNCIAKEINNSEAENFLNKYHYQGFIPAKVTFGLFYDNELVQLESFGKPRIECQNNTIWHDWELYRECSKSDYYIIGGKSKLLKAFEQKCKPLCLLSYCNETLGFDGHSYEACGFVKNSVTKDYWYEYKGEKIKRYAMQKNRNLAVPPIMKTLNKYGKTYYPELTEKENAEKAGFVRVEGLGQATWTKTYSDFIGYVYDFELNEKHYIGQHTLFKDGIWHKEYNGSGVVWLKAVKKYGARSIKKTVIKWYRSEYVMKKMEIHYIRKAASIYGKENMYNVNFTRDATSQLWRFDENKNMTMRQKISSSMKGRTPWNKGMFGYKTQPCSEERKAKIGAAHKGMRHSEETKAKMSKLKKEMISHMTDEEKKTFGSHNKGKIAWNKGKTLSKEQVNKQRESLKKYYETHDGSNKGRKFGQDTRDKISQAKKGNRDFEKKLNNAGFLSRSQVFSKFNEVTGLSLTQMKRFMKELNIKSPYSKDTPQILIDFCNNK